MGNTPKLEGHIAHQNWLACISHQPLVSRSQTLHPFLLIMTAGGESGGLSYTKLFPEVRRELGSQSWITQSC